MKNLIVPTNFTVNANKVLKYAINLANQFGSTIHLVHVYQKDASMGKLQTRREAMDKLEQTAQLFERELYFTTFIKTTLMEGPVVNQICTFSKKVDADLIVLGGAESWRSTGMNKIITEVVHRSRTSVFIVPNGYSYRPLNYLTLAIDKKVLTSDPEIKPLIDITNGINGYVKILEVAKARVLTCVEIGEKVQDDVFPYETFHIHHDSINSGIQEFISESETDVLCFINREYGLSGRFLNNLATRKGNEAKLIPLLLLHGKVERFGMN